MTETETASREGGGPPHDAQRITRGDTGLRILATVFMLIIWAVVRPVLLAVTAFSLLFTLITEQAPPDRLRELANRLVTYTYRIGRYITYNDTRVPFPLSDFPEALEPPADLGRGEVPELRDLLERRKPMDDDFEDDLDDERG